MLVTTKAIVLAAIKYGEADLIVSCFTQRDGPKSYLLRNILKSKKGKVRASYFQPLTQLELVANHKNKGTLESIREAKVTFPYQTLHTDIVKSSLVMFHSEVLKATLREEEPNEQLFSFLERSFKWLDGNTHVGNFHIHFLLKLSNYLGFHPDTSDIEGQYFNLQEGVFQQRAYGLYCEEGPEIVALKSFFGIEFDASSQIKLTKNSRTLLLNLLLRYYQLHAYDFKNPRSLLVLNQLFT
ncbi:MAG: DNA repair protein RecO [Flavobacteriaceae bacterium]|nr:DNA repair protein RecO [Flavobacteriaceae bacterium]